jgi:hypothetical protein
VEPRQDRVLCITYNGALHGSWMKVWGAERVCTSLWSKATSVLSIQNFAAQPSALLGKKSSTGNAIRRPDDPMGNRIGL